MEEPDGTRSLDALVDELTIILHAVADVVIPQLRGGPPRHRITWWNNECAAANAARKRALRRYHRTREVADKIAYNRARARAQNIKDRPFLPSYPPAFLAHKHQQEQQALDFSTNAVLSYNDPLTMTELYCTLKKFKDTAPGPDGIHYQMLKKMHYTAISHLLHIYNKMWNAHTYPHQWRTATTLACAKPNKPPSKPKNYRPIASTSCIDKLMEKIVNIRRTRWLEADELVNSVQFGLRQNRGTIDAFVRLQNYLVANLDERRQTLCVFFDLHEAYDTAWRYGILKTLHGYGLRGNMAMYAQEFLGERSLLVKVGGTLSPMQVQHVGLPQGSVMSCTLFSVGLNKFTSVLPPDVSASLYVDDFMRYSSSTHLPALSRSMQMAINNVNWVREHGFVPEKSVRLYFQRRNPCNLPQLVLQGRIMNFVRSAKFLGMIVDDKLSWKPHLNSLKLRWFEVWWCFRVLRCFGHPIIGEIYDILMQLVRALKHVRICWMPGHVGVSGNERADFEAKRAAASEGQTLNECVPCRDYYYPLVKVAVRELWQQQWAALNHNKLRKIKNTAREWTSYLMELLPNLSVSPLTVEHFLAVCPSHAGVRRARFPGLRGDDADALLRGMQCCVAYWWNLSKPPSMSMH
ncbi:Reverse transcriptase domain [Trinorchestia longiramus]|nr:Reverse transcriptase domain [Trinorchestia longiramus]